MSNGGDSNPQLTVCTCNICSGRLRFKTSCVGETLQCPHCGVDTVLFVPQVPLDATPEVVIPPPKAEAKQPRAFVTFHKITCPACKQHIEIPVELFGESITCPHCNQAFVVPTSREPQGKPPLRTGVQTINRTVIFLGCLLAGLWLFIGFSARLNINAPQKDEEYMFNGAGLLLAVAVWAKLFPSVATFVCDLFAGISRWSRRQ